MSRVGEIIANQKLFGQRAGEEPFAITIEIGRPYKWGGTSPTEWACPLKVDPFDNLSNDAHGEGSFQALCLALYLVQLQLVHFKEAGGILLHEDGQEFALDIYWHSNEAAAASMS